jgi:putative SOS response-associated peptidase YedK
MPGAGVPVSPSELQLLARQRRLVLFRGDLAACDPRLASTPDWPEAYAILTTEANADIAPFHDRQMVVLTRDQRMAWLDALVAEDEILRPLPAGTFRVRRHSTPPVQTMLAV